MDLKWRKSGGYSIRQKDAGQFLLGQVSAEGEASLAALAAELRCAVHTGLETRNIRGRIDACLSEMHRT